jgi:ATP-dependent DNA helicase PIF1
MNWLYREFPGQEHIYLSADEVADRQDTHSALFVLPTEYLNTIIVPGFPLHKTILKVGCPILLLRNLQASLGLCNGTRLLVTALRPRVIQAVILTGRHRGQSVFLPRISLDSPSNIRLPFVMRRRAFPIRVAFAMTINKAQGQTIRHVGVSLLNPVFSHGQLYVALSRSTDFRNMKVLLPPFRRRATASQGESHQPPRDGFFTLNIVFTEVLGQC